TQSMNNITRAFFAILYHKLNYMVLLPLSILLIAYLLIDTLFVWTKDHQLAFIALLLYTRTKRFDPQALDIERVKSPYLTPFKMFCYVFVEKLSLSLNTLWKELLPFVFGVGDCLKRAISRSTPVDELPPYNNVFLVLKPNTKFVGPNAGF
ncbi:hypothetical protein ACJX0J_036460, partial [Zea mays]